MNMNDFDTWLVYLIDRSGSMRPAWEDTIGGLNGDLDVQKNTHGDGTLVSVYFFDSNHRDTDLVRAYEGTLNEVPVFSHTDPAYIPRGTTPLHDAAGLVITEVKEKIETDGANPTVLVSIFTDGLNNCHHGYTSDQVKQMVEICEGRGWTFTYFGANQDAWDASSSLGIAAGNTVQYSVENMAQTMAMASVARAAFVGESKLAKARDANAVYRTKTFFADAGQKADDYT